MPPKRLKSNPWITHVKKYWKAHPSLTYGECMKKAAPSYRKKGTSTLAKKKRIVRRVMKKVTKRKGKRRGRGLVGGVLMDGASLAY